VLTLSAFFLINHKFCEGSTDGGTGELESKHWKTAYWRCNSISVRTIENCLWVVLQPSSIVKIRPQRGRAGFGPPHRGDVCYRAAKREWWKNGIMGVTSGVGLILYRRQCHGLKLDLLPPNPVFQHSITPAFVGLDLRHSQSPLTRVKNTGSTTGPEDPIFEFE
jgi:hypothetical protein